MSATTGEPLSNSEVVASVVRRAVAATTVTDVHTHLFPPAHGQLLLWGPDELLTYHYLVAEFFMVAPRECTQERFWGMPKRAQADLIWQELFLKRGALSEAARGVITTFNALGLDVAGRDLEGVRKWFAGRQSDGHLAEVFRLAGIDAAIMTNNPFVEAEAAFLDRALPCPPTLKASLRIDPLLLDWKEAAAAMKRRGYRVGTSGDRKTHDQVRRFLLDWARKIGATYFAASLPPEFAYPDGSAGTRMLDRAVIPAAVEAGVPLALMIGVRKRVQPALGDGGDAVAPADMTAVMHLCQQYPQAKFLVTVLSRVNQHELCVLARKFRNLHLFGCWWFCNNPSIIEEMTRQRLELLGTAFTCQHSDARVLEQVVYKWAHTRQIVADVLVDKYRDLLSAGWRPTEPEIARDVRALFGGSFAEFLRK